MSASYDKSVRVWDVATGTSGDILFGGELILRQAKCCESSNRAIQVTYSTSNLTYRELLGTSPLHSRLLAVGRTPLLDSTSHDQRIVVLDFSEGLDGAELFM